NVARLEDLLAEDRTFEIIPGYAPIRSGTSGATHDDALAADLDKGLVHCPQHEGPMLKNAVHLEREARTARDEGGANVLYVAVGLLKWFESDSSPNPRFAPLLLVPLSLEYIRTTRQIRIKRLPEDSVPNSTLVEKMRADFGLDLESLATVAADDRGRDVPGLVRGPREEAYVVRFSFTKFLMWKDLEENQDVLLQNDVIRHTASKSNEGLPDKGGD